VIEIWGGVECTVNRVGSRWCDQCARSGHDRREDDLDRIASLGIAAVRYPVLWERVAPRGLAEADWRWTDARLAGLRNRGLRPIVGLLHHGSGPAYTDLLDQRFPERLAEYASAVAERYPWVADFTPVNEPLTTARFSALYGYWYPHAADDRSFVRALVNELRGTALAMSAIRAVTPAARLIQTEDCGRTFGTRATALQAAFEEHRRWLTFDLLSGRVNREHPLWRWLHQRGATAAELEFFVAHPCLPDVVGLNYYLTSDRWLDHRLARYPAATHGSNGRIAYADVEAVRARRDGIVGHEEHLMAAWERYGLPVAITEVHVACTREEQMRWLVESWHAAHRARARGADVRAITAWALLGSYDWNSLVTRDAGHYEPGAFDLRAPAPRATALARVIHTIASGAEPEHPVLAAPGWWRRSNRLLYGPSPPTTTLPGPPLLIVGASGTLGRAFMRIAGLRGLAARLLGRPQCDATDPGRIDALIRRLRPWAVVNTAGYVRVDAAEGDRDACHRGNVTTAVNLAAACCRHGIKLVTFSSDLVFDGTLQRPYVEGDEPAPLNVYGATKAEAERRVRDLLPDGLVIRSSAFFGPWDEANFVAALLRALDSGLDFPAACDTTVSPTYVPDLVNATLDLLIDEAEGVWHLANAGAITWSDFARVAAEACGRPVDLIRPVPTTEVWNPARRPAFSALASSRAALMPPLEAAVAAFAAERTAAAMRGVESCASP
jgi:dTDP-4-dehydrorhamnose reductase